VRQWVTPRSLLLHLAFIVIASGCLIAGWWQVHRAMQGNTLSYLYSVEWPAFAVVAGIGWWQMFHDTPEDIAARKAHHAKMREASRQVVARTLPRSALAITVGSKEIDTGRILESGSAAAARTAAIGAGVGDAEGDGPGAALMARPSSLAGLGDGEGRTMAPDLDDEGAPTDDMTDYNRYLALLAVRGRPKTWRNPRGV
jgi:hypothetical protein